MMQTRTGNRAEATLEDGQHPNVLMSGSLPLQVSEVHARAHDFIDHVHGCNTVDSIEKLFHSFVTTLGFSGAMCLKKQEIGEEPESCFVLNTFTDRWRKRYLELGLLAHDPMLNELGRSYGAFSWSELRARRSLTAQQQQVFQEAAAEGLLDGFCVPIFEAGGYSGIIVLAGPYCTITQDLRPLVISACLVMHGKLSQLRRQLQDAAFELTERELECLRWAAVGKSDWEIGQILNISAKTVNYHIENTKRKFSVATRVQAIVAALRAGKLIG
jgi:LuxR family transcriptional regulator, quorum-sensing system regulator BjaR1